MKVYSFPTRVAGTNIFVSHINDIQGAINYLSTELTNGIGSVDTPRVFKVAAAATGYASFNVPPAGGTPSAPASGDLWNDAGTLKFYNGTATKSVAFTDTVGGGSGDVSSNTSTSVDSEVVLFSGTGGKTVKRATISGLAKLSSGVLSAAEITGTSNQITVTNGTGVSGNPSIALSSTAVAPGTLATTGWFGVKTSSAYGSSDVTIGDATDGDLWLAMRGKDSSNAELRLVQGVFNGTDRGFMGTATAHGFSFRTNNADRLTIDSSGNATFEAAVVVKGSTTLATTLTGPLKAASGVVSASSVNLTSEVTGILPAANGGTGITNIATIYAALASPTFTGTPAAPTAAADTNTTQIATTAYVVGQGYLKSATASSTYAALSHSHAISDVTNLQTNLDLKAALASPTFTGTPAAPTAAADTNTTQVATTAYVVGQASATSPVVNGTAAVGTSLKYARADHVHPTDTSRAASSHTHAIADVTSLQTSLDGKAATSHSHTVSNITDIATTYAPLSGPTFTGTVTLPTTTTKFGTSAGILKAAVTTGNLSVGTVGLAAASAEVSGILPIANGGTGQSTANAALNSLLPSQTSNSGRYLTTDGTDTSWAVVSGGGSSDLNGLSDVEITSAVTGNILLHTGTNFVNVDSVSNVSLVIGDGVNAISTGYQDIAVSMPFGGVVIEWYAYQIGGTSITGPSGTWAFSIYRSTYATYPANTSTTFVVSGSLSGSTTNKWTATGLSAAFTANDIFRVNVTDADANIKLISINLKVRRTS